MQPSMAVKVWIRLLMSLSPTKITKSHEAIFLINLIKQNVHIQVLDYAQNLVVYNRPVVY